MDLKVIDMTNKFDIYPLVGVDIYYNMTHIILHEIH
jgi:hypothetical protein